MPILGLVEDKFIELQRCRDSCQLEEVTDILKSSFIPYDLGSTAPNFDLASLGSGSNAEVVIRVPLEAYDEARSALESEYLKLGLPNDHYLLNSTDDEIVEIVANSSDWSAYDVAHARQIMKERSLNFAEVSAKKSLRLAELKKGKKIPLYLLVTGWAFSVLGGFWILGGFIGLGIAWSLCTMKEKTPKGEFHTYDEKSRNIGKNMGRVAFIILILNICSKLS